jgi:LysM repeat protein
LNSQNIVNKAPFFTVIRLKAPLSLGLGVFYKPANYVENMLRTCISFFFATLLLAQAAANDPKARYSRAEYIAAWKDVAMRQMKEHGIPASITLAQAILESGDGNSRLARDANNHFGIKCHDWKGKKVYHDDDARNECFRKYGNADESFADHSEFLKRSRYAFLFDYEITDYKSWAKGLKQAGYATNPKYPELLIRLIEENNLTAYDMEAMGKMPKGTKGSKAVPKTEKDSGDEIVLTLGAGPPVYLSDNRIKYIISEEGHTPESLASKLDMAHWQLRRYNDFEKGQRIAEGTRVYLQPKRNSAAKARTHVVQEGESLWDISQKYGVKQKKLLKKSGFDANYQVRPGDTITLR